MEIKPEPINNKLYDKWTINHILFSFFFGWFIGPIATFIVTLVYEPIEIFWLQKIFSKFGITFGNEGLINSLSDIVFNTVSLIAGYYILSHFLGISPWFLM